MTSVSRSKRGPFVEGRSFFFFFFFFWFIWQPCLKTQERNLINGSKFLIVKNLFAANPDIGHTTLKMQVLIKKQHVKRIKRLTVRLEMSKQVQQPD